MASTPRKDQVATTPQLPALLFDLDGTLVDSVYQHIAAWRETLEAHDIHVASVRIHRSVGMSGKLMLRAIFAEQGRKHTSDLFGTLEKLHKRKFKKELSTVRVLPGARQLLSYLSKTGIRWAIATSGDQKTVRRMIRSLPVPSSVPVVTGDDVERAKPHPDVFLQAATQLGVSLQDCLVVGDSVWDMLAAQRAKALGVGLLTGGYASTELAEAGAFRIYKDPGDLLQHIAELGVVDE